MVLKFVTIGIMFLVLGCSLPEPCCQECLQQSQQDASGYDITIKECADYTLSIECQEFFIEKPLRVGQC